MHMSDTYFDSSISADDKRIQFVGYNLSRADHSNNTKTGGVCIYSSNLVIKVLDIPSINKCLLYEVSVQNKRGYASVMYRSPNQNNDELHEFLNSFENPLNVIAKSSPLFTKTLGNFNARCKSWWVNDNTTIEGTRLEAITTFHSFEQLISVATGLLPM